MIIKKILHTYPNFTIDIENLNIENKCITGILGENGAGKSTFMNIISGYLIPNKFFEFSNFKNTSILYIPSDLKSYDYLTVDEFLKLVIKYSKSTVSLENLLIKLNMEDKRNNLIDDLSLGMKKKLTLTPLFLKNYDLIILDEPFNSIDLNYIYNLKQYLLSLKSKSTILISSHILDTLSDICDTFILIKDGRVEKYISNNKNKLNLEREIFGADI